MSPLRILGIIIILAVIGGIVFCVTRPKTETISESCASKAQTLKIVAFGDSLVAGYGANTAGGFVTLLSTEAGIPITNLGVSGNTSAEAKARVTTVLGEKPDINLVLLGGNDALQQVSQSETEQNLAEIISTLQKGGSRVVLLGVLGGFPLDPYAPMFERLATTYNVTYVPNVLSGIIGHTSLMSDQVHPNEAGYQKIADRLLPVLEKECGG